MSYPVVSVQQETLLAQKDGCCLPQKVSGESVIGQGMWGSRSSGAYPRLSPQPTGSQGPRVVQGTLDGQACVSSLLGGSTDPWWRAGLASLEGFGQNPGFPCTLMQLQPQKPANPPRVSQMAHGTRSLLSPEDRGAGARMQAELFRVPRGPETVPGA